jgi:hypothetical protein
VPITYEILREGRVGLFTYPSTFTMPEVTAISETYQREVLDKATKKVYTITDLSAVTQLPPNILSGSVNLIRNAHPMNGPMIEVTPNPFINRLANVLSKVFPSGKVTVRKTLAEALAEVDRLIAQEVTENIG